jgi:hypothetical protein
MTGGGISDSYSSGFVTGIGDTAEVGGLVGRGWIPVENSYWNADSNSSAVGSQGKITGGTGNQGLASDQFADIQNYRDGTISDVLAGRAATASISNQAGQIASQARQEQSDPSTLSSRVVEQHQSDMDNHIVYADSADYSADIKAIDADGVQFELDDKSSKMKK